LVDRERARTEKQRRIAVEQREIADRQRAIATENAARAVRNLRLAQNAADGLLSDVAEVALADIPHVDRVRHRLLQQARAGYQQLLAEKGDDPLIRWGANRSIVRLADILALLGEAPKAESTYRQAIADLDELARNDPANADFRRDLARAKQGL